MKCKNPNCTTKTINWISDDDIPYLEGLCYPCYGKIIAAKIAEWKAQKKMKETGCPF